MSSPPRYLLDTSVLVHYCRGSDLGQFIEEQYQLNAATQVPLISIVTEGELRAFARNHSWGASKIQILNRLLGHYVRVNLDFPGVIAAYADIDQFSRHPPTGSAREMGKNDLWIAATAKVTGAHLLTTDKDFDHLNGTQLSCHYIDPSSKL